MRNRQRLIALKKWVYETACKGRIMKTPGRDEDGAEDVTIISRQEPVAYLGWYPQRPDMTGLMPPDPLNVCPGILISQNPDYAKYVEEKRFDRYKGVHRPQEMGQWIGISMLFSVYEPGIRLPGFVQRDEDGNVDGIDLTKYIEGTEEGYLSLVDWMDDVKDALIAQKIIPHSDMAVDEESITIGPYTQSDFVADKRPIYYGILSARFQGYSENKAETSIEKFLE